MRSSLLTIALLFSSAALADGLFPPPTARGEALGLLDGRYYLKADPILFANGTNAAPSIAPTTDPSVGFRYGAGPDAFNALIIDGDSSAGGDDTVDIICTFFQSFGTSGQLNFLGNSGLLTYQRLIALNAAGSVVGLEIDTNATQALSTGLLGVGTLTLAVDTAVTLSGGDGGINFDSGTLIVDAATNQIQTAAIKNNGALSNEKCTATVASNAVTCSATSGVLTDDTTNISLSSTRADITWTNTRIASTSVILLTICKKPADANVSLVAMVTPGSGTATLSIRNDGLGNLTTDNDVKICFQVSN